MAFSTIWDPLGFAIQALKVGSGQACRLCRKIPGVEVSLEFKASRYLGNLGKMTLHL